MYGCGGTENLAMEQLPTDSWEGKLVVTADHRPAVLPRARGVALLRRMRSRAQHLPATLGYGIGGTMFGCLALWLVTGNARADEILTLIGSGVLHGFAAPFLAPIQHRRPFRTALIGLTSFTVLFAFLENSHGWESFGPPLLAVWLVSWMVASSSLADALAGPRTRLGQALSKAAGIVRFGGTWVLSVLIFIVCANLVDASLNGARTLHVVLSLASAVTIAAFPALEKGKSEYRMQLPPGRR